MLYYKTLIEKNVDMKVFTWHEMLYQYSLSYAYVWYDVVFESVSCLKNAGNPEQMATAKNLLSRWTQAAIDWAVDVSFENALSKVRNPNAKKTASNRRGLLVPLAQN